MFNAKLPDCGPFAQAITAAGEVLDEGYFKGKFCISNSHRNYLLMS